jgi:prepilin-type N-terminal cleavage/methylation domain-containing protein
MTRRGMTLIEMLVALTATLLLMAAIAQAFSAFGGAINDSRAVLELDARMRNVAWRLRSDLAGATARMLPPASADAGEGYFEIIEGPAKDSDAAAGMPVGPADHDDVLLLTTRSVDSPFVGRGPAIGGTTLLGQTSTFESTLAEIAWFARPTPNTSIPQTYTLYRKQLLVMGYVGTDPFVAVKNTMAWSTAGSTWAGYFDLPCDVSARLEVTTSGSSTLFPNTLADLARRQCRFLHNPDGFTSGTTGFPFRFAKGDHQTLPAQDGLIFSTPQRQGEDVVLSNVLSFDVRVFDPAAPVAVQGQTALVPGDPGFPTGAVEGSGAYVDLGNGVTSNSMLASVGGGIVPRFADFGRAKSKLVGTGTSPRTFDTWTTHYEANGRDEDGANEADQGTNGLDDDDDGDGTVDDAGELETSPPYPWPLRGIEVRIRCYEPSSRQVRQVTVRHTFVPH